MKKFLVSGMAGFSGSHLVEVCAAEAYNVRAFVRYNFMEPAGGLACQGWDRGQGRGYPRL
jgi:nucleoside-diphosphate-sugar epimerase